jgi:uncharacterized protein (TIGR02328 family)
MRLWHKDLLPVLPRQQLVAQWRELSAISGRLALVGSPQHLLVNKLTRYSWLHFIQYCDIVYKELVNRGIHVNHNVYDKIYSQTREAFAEFEHKLIPYEGVIFNGWHDSRYLKQCYYNLQEKYVCGGITSEEFCKIEQVVRKQEHLIN